MGIVPLTGAVKSRPKLNPLRDGNVELAGVYLVVPESRPKLNPLRDGNLLIDC